MPCTPNTSSDVCDFQTLRLASAIFSGGKDITETKVSFRDLLSHVLHNTLSAVITTQGFTKSILNICQAWTEHVSAFTLLTWALLHISCAVVHSCRSIAVVRFFLYVSSSKCHESLRIRHTFPLVSGMYTSLICPVQGWSDPDFLFSCSFTWSGPN